MGTNSIWKSTFSLVRAMRYYINGGMLLMIMAVLALIMANSPWAGAYFSFWQQPVHLQIGSFNVFNHGGHPLTLLEFINDALMAVFFFSTGLEIKRESLVGELSSFRQAMLPIIAACGGMIMPVLIFVFIAHGTPAEGGMAIPMATDIAFSLGVLSLFGKRVPLSLKIFLTTFAVADDIGGILVIALFYSTHLSYMHLLLSAVILLILCAGNAMKVYNRWFYLCLGAVMWYLFLQSGIHATIAGVVVAFTIPATPRESVGKYIDRIKSALSHFTISPKQTTLLSNEQIDTLKKVEEASDRIVSPLQALEDDLYGFVTYVVMPVFAFANAGVTIVKPDGSIEYGVVSTAIIAGLVIGKFVGIYSFTAISILTGLTKMPKGMSFKNLTGICLLGGIGFTVSLFIAQLSFGNDPDLLGQSKIGVVCGTVIAGILGSIVLKLTLPKKTAE